MVLRRTLDPAIREELRTRLGEVRMALLRTVATTDEELATLAAREPGPPIEDAAREEMVGILARLGDRERLVLDEITGALERLAAGTYGTCDGCEGAIPLPRLRAMPAARLCLSCQAIREERAAAGG